VVTDAPTGSAHGRKAPRIGGRPATIASLATYVPPRLLTNADLEKMVETTDDWILQRTGIRERHIVDPGVATSDLGKEAAVKAIAAAGLTPNDIGVVIVGTVTPDMVRAPGGPATLMQPFVIARAMGRTSIGTLPVAW
jgi:3-oxoacyl-[acyl-carrier-protein] synthase III